MSAESQSQPSHVSPDAARPRELPNMSMAEFAATYTTGGKDGQDETGDHIAYVLDGSDKNEAGGDEEDDDEIHNIHPSVINLKNCLRCMKKRNASVTASFASIKKRKREKISIGIC